MQTQGAELSRACRPLVDWPEADQHAWSVAITPGDCLEAGGKGEAWSPVTRAGIIKSYGRWLTWLEHAGRLDPVLPPGKRVTPRAVSAFMAALETINAPKTVLHRITGLAQAIRAMALGLDWDWLWGIVARLQRTAVATRNKRSRLVEPDELFALGGDLMRQAERSKRPGWEKALQFRDGLVIQLLVTRPLRIGNLAAIEIDRHLVPTAQGFDLRFPADEMKNRRPDEGAIEAELVAPLTHYLLYYRPLLVARHRTPRLDDGSGPGATLWLSKSGAPMLPNKLYERIVWLTEKRFGQPINPHLFRDIIATAIATKDPEHVRITASVLGHARLSTSEQYYNHARSLAARQLYQTWILDLRRKPASR